MHNSKNSIQIHIQVRTYVWLSVSLSLSAAMSRQDTMANLLRIQQVTGAHNIHAFITWF